jgi:hypothetical protein
VFLSISFVAVYFMLMNQQNLTMMNVITIIFLSWPLTLNIFYILNTNLLDLISLFVQYLMQFSTCIGVK